NPLGIEYHPPAPTGSTQTPSAAPPTTVVINTSPSPDVVTTSSNNQTPTPVPIQTTVVAAKTSSIPFVVTPSSVTAITAGPGEHTGPVMSASGDVVYDPDGAIYFYDHEHNETTTIASPAGGWSYGSPTISSDGRYILFQGDNGTGSYVFVYGTDSSDPIHYHV